MRDGDLENSSGTKSRQRRSKRKRRFQLNINVQMDDNVREEIEECLFEHECLIKLKYLNSIPLIYDFCIEK
jgi:hypothetical protein